MTSLINLTSIVTFDTPAKPNGPRAQVYNCCSQPVSLPSAYFPTQRVVGSRDSPKYADSIIEKGHTRVQTDFLEFNTVTSG